MELIVSVSGIRGIVGQNLYPEDATRFAAALGSTFGHGSRVIVSRDSRPSGAMLKHAVIAGLLSVGCDVDDIGIAPTPTVGVAVRTLNAAGAIQITASHNPAPWNGLKMFGNEGAVLNAAQGAEVRAAFEANDFPRANWESVGQMRSSPDVTEEHLQKVLDCVDVARIASQRFNVFLDGNGGAGGPMGVQLLNALGCEVVQYHCQADGDFAHEPEPIPANLIDVAPYVQTTNCNIGFVLDPDSDRLALIDETGTCISEELTCALAAMMRLRQNVGSVVVNMSSSRINADIANDAGSSLHRSPVGEANVVALMRATNAVIGGEGSGGVIDPRIGWVRDPFIGMSLILNLLVEEGKTVSELVASLPQYTMHKAKYPLEREKLPKLYDSVRTRWPDATVDTQDGLRLDGPDWWIHVRASNTEQVVRVIAESAENAEALCNEVQQLM